MTTESQELVERYLDYFDMGDTMSDVRFVFTQSGCRIHQPIDDEEDDKYDVVRNEVDPVLWGKFEMTFGPKRTS